MTQPNEALKPCPCGERAFVAHVNCNSQVWCSRDICWKGPIRETPEEAIAAWNRRTPPSSDVERVARALFDADNSWHGYTWETLPKIARELFTRNARAAIAAMQPPKDIGE